MRIHSRIATAILPLLLLACSHTGRDIAFVSKHATEATLRFSHRVEIQSRRKPSAARAREQVELQVQHLFGPLERGKFKAAPKEDHKIRILSTSKKTDGLYEITYEYEGTVVVEKGPRKYLELLLPINPSTIYSDSLVNGKNPCTDDHYQDEGDFWYFWSPAPTYPDCKLKEGEHYSRLNGAIERLDGDSRTTYPEYHRLAHKGAIDIHIFFGMDEAKSDANPYESNDINAENYVSTREDLEKLGFSVRRWSEKEIRSIAKNTRLPSAFVEEAVKRIPKKDIEIRVRLFFGQSGIDERSRAFHHFLRDSLERSSILIYDGHSGLGGNLDLDSIAESTGFRMQPAKGRYQIFFFNSCTSYTYYNALYFQKKRNGRRGKNFDPKGTRNLDVMANGLSTYFDVLHNTDMTLIRAVMNWAERSIWTSYRRLATDIDSDNLFTVNGDEDNPRKPVRNID